MQRRKFIKNLGLASGIVLPSLSIGKSISEVILETKAKKQFTLAFITDIHVKKLEAAELGMKKALLHINKLKKKPDFIINGGDSIMDALAVDKEKTQEQWNLFHSILNENNSLPIKHCIGNHDIWGWQLKDESIKSDSLYAKNWWKKETKNPNSYYSFIHNNWKFIFLDSIQQNEGGYIALLDDEQFIWLENELENSKPYHVCIVSHIPIISYCSAMFFKDMLPNGDWKLSRVLLHVDGRKIKNLFKKHLNIKACLSGHIHLQDEVNYLGIKYFCNGAISGNWWNGPFQDFEPAYALFHFSKNGEIKREMVEYS